MMIEYFSRCITHSFGGAVSSSSPRKSVIACDMIKAIVTQDLDFHILGGQFTELGKWYKNFIRVFPLKFFTLIISIGEFPHQVGEYFPVVCSVFLKPKFLSTGI
jgi:hypothetical protein